jgi:glutaredoxin
VLKNNVTNFQCMLVLKKSSLQESQLYVRVTFSYMPTLQLRLQTSVPYIVLYDVHIVMNVCPTMAWYEYLLRAQWYECI